MHYETNKTNLSLNIVHRHSQVIIYLKQSNLGFLNLNLKSPGPTNPRWRQLGTSLLSRFGGAREKSGKFGIFQTIFKELGRGTKNFRARETRLKTSCENVVFRSQTLCLAQESSSDDVLSVCFRRLKIVFGTNADHMRQTKP